MARPPHHKAATEHVTTHDVPMALDTDSLLELQLKHTEDYEQHRDRTPPGMDPTASDPADPNRANSPQSAPSQPLPRERAPWTHLSNALRPPRSRPTHPQSQPGPCRVPDVLRALPDRPHWAGAARVHHHPPLSRRPHRRMKGGERHYCHRHDGVHEKRGGPGARHNPHHPCLPQLEMRPRSHPPPATERTPPVVPRAESEMEHRPPAQPRGLLYPRAQRITRRRTHCTDTAADQAPGG